MSKKLILGLSLSLVNLTALPAAQRLAVPGARVLGMQTARIAPCISQRLVSTMPAVRAAVASSLPKVVAGQGQNKTHFDIRAYMALAGLVVAAGVDQVVKCDTGENVIDELNIAISHSDVKAVKELLVKPGIDVNALDQNGYSALHKAFIVDARERALSVVKDCQINKTDIDVVIRLYQEDKIEIIKMLLARSDIQVNLLDGKYKSTPLHWAAVVGDVEAIKLLFSYRGVDLNAIDKNGNTPLHDVINHDNVEALKLFLAHPEVKLKVFDKDGDGPLYRAFAEANCLTSIEIQKKGREMLKILLACPSIDPNEKKGSTTVLKRAIFRKDLDTVKKILDHPGTRVNMWDFSHEISDNPEMKLLLLNFLATRMTIERGNLDWVRLYFKYDNSGMSKEQFKLIKSKATYSDRLITKLNSVINSAFRAVGL